MPDGGGGHSPTRPISDRGGFALHVRDLVVARDQSELAVAHFIKMLRRRSGPGCIIEADHVGIPAALGRIGHHRGRTLPDEVPENWRGNRTQVNHRIDMRFGDQAEIVVLFAQFAGGQDDERGVLAAQFGLDPADDFQVVRSHRLFAQHVADQAYADHRALLASLLRGERVGHERSLRGHAVNEPFLPQFPQGLAHRDFVHVELLGQLVHRGQAGEGGQFPVLDLASDPLGNLTVKVLVAGFSPLQLV